MRLRPVIARLHRWIGLVTAGFLLVAGLTGALLAWYDELDAMLAPQLLAAHPPPGIAQPLDALALRARVTQAYPHRQVNHVPLSQAPGRSAVFFVEPGPGATGKPVSPMAQVLVQPYTGEVLGDRVLGQAGRGAQYVMPFIYRLHHSLALGSAGTLVLGAAALLWTVDCFIGLWLTLPAASSPQRRTGRAVGKPWLQRWMPAWQLRWHAGGHKLAFDLHRAGGLWTWAMLFVFAWSSVAFNLAPAYDAIMARGGLSFQATTRSLPMLAVPQDQPGLSWQQARETGRRLMEQQASSKGFSVHREDLLYYDPRRALFSYYVHSSLDVQERVGRTVVSFDANTGELRLAWFPTGVANGDTITSWLAGLHMAARWGWPLQALVAIVGLMTAMLSVTGVLLWRRKSEARKRRPTAS
ncbi:PepSY domain-containing protein [Pigmentiphaga sp. NML080357]|uniref:PepSY-associated TM helix domain-containing protein n=1 Tax=Pigmentiphaga sp. NML080357 TaxID=2008675 RepID=UPI0013034AC2|nr:PepSY-associated TM helix domain-containing protein [Pigmentiphaga sp. NML080357]